MYGFAAASLCVAALAAQAPKPPADLTQIADRLATDGTVAAVLAALPVKIRDEFGRHGALLTPSERQVAMAELPPTHTLGLAAAIAELVESDAHRESAPSAADLLRQARAAHTLARGARGAKLSDRVLGTGGGATLEDVAASARACSHAAVAKLLREHPDSPDVVSALALAGEPVAREQLIGAILARALPATQAERVGLATQLLASGDLAGAQRVLDAISAGTPPALPERREQLVAMTRDLAHRLARASEWQQVAAKSGSDAARLQFLRFTDFAAACARSEQADASLGALPAMLLALRAHGKGDYTTARPLIDRALAADDADTSTVLLDVSIAMAEARLAHSRDELLEKITASLARADTRLRDDPSEPAVVFGKLRELGWPRSHPRQFLSHLDALHELARAQPTSLAAAITLYGACSIAHDGTAAMAILREPPASSLAGAAGPLRCRAEAAVCIARRLTDRAAAAALIQTTTFDLETCGDGAWADHLRRLAAWNPRAPDRSVAPAAASFPVSSRNAWPHHVAAWTAQVLASGFEQADHTAMQRVRAIQLPELTIEDQVSWYVTLLHHDGSRRNSRSCREMQEALRSSPAEAMVLESAIAAACNRDGDRTGAREAATRALRHREDCESPALELIDGGLLAGRTVNFGLNVTPAGAELSVDFHATLYPLPPLPTAAELTRWRRND